MAENISLRCCIRTRLLLIGVASMETDRVCQDSKGDNRRIDCATTSIVLISGPSHKHLAPWPPLNPIHSDLTRQRFKYRGQTLFCTPSDSQSCRERILPPDLNHIGEAQNRTLLNIPFNLSPRGLDSKHGEFPQEDVLSNSNFKYIVTPITMIITATAFRQSRNRNTGFTHSRIWIKLETIGGGEQDYQDSRLTQFQKSFSSYSQVEVNLFPIFRTEILMMELSKTIRSVWLFDSSILVASL